MTSHQTQPSLNPFPGHIFVKRSNSSFETSKPPLKAWRTVGGIDESPLHPKHTQHPITTNTLTSAAHLFNSRLFSKTQHSSTQPANVLPARHPFNSSSFTRTHKSTFSDSTAVSSIHPHHTLNKSSIPSYHQPPITPILDQNQTYQHPPSSHSVVASLGLAPISNSIPSRHPFNLRPLRVPKDPSNNSPHVSPNHTASSVDPFLSFPKLPSIPSLLNPERASSLAIDQPQTNNRDDDPSSDYTKITHHSSCGTHDSPRTSLEITASDRPLVSNHPFPSSRSLTYSSHARPTHPSPPTSVPLPRCDSPVVAGLSDTSSPPRIEPLVPPLETNMLEKQTHRQHVLFFEPAGNAFVKYASPQPRLSATKSSQRSNVSGQHRYNKNNRIPDTHPYISTCKKLREMSSDSSLEELRDRYWNSKHHNRDVNQVWAEIYISQLERKLWKSEAEADISVDCLNFCSNFGSNTKSKKSHRRTSSAPNLKNILKPSSLAHADHRGNKTPLDSTAPVPARSKFDHGPLRKPFPFSKTLSNLMSSCPSTPFNVTNGSLNGFPCITPKSAATANPSNPSVPQSDSKTRHRANSAPRTSTHPDGIRREATSNDAKNISESHYRIVVPNDSNPPNLRNPKTLWRRSRSVPNLSEKRSEGRFGARDPPHDLWKTTSQPASDSVDQPRSLADPNLSTNPKVPQSLLDAMFPPPLEPKEKAAVLSSGKLPNVQSQIDRGLIRASEYATIETHPDNLSGEPEIIQATDEGPKGPLHSLPRFIEPRSNVIIALPPPPRKRTVTPVASTDSQSGISLPGTKRSTTQSTPSHSSWGTPSHNTHSNSLSPSSSKMNRRFSPALTIRNNLPKSTSSQSATSPPVLPRLSASMVDPYHPLRPRSLSFAPQTSPSVESGVDSGKRLSGFVSESSSRLCSLDLQSVMIDNEYGFDSLPNPPYNEPPLSAFHFAKLTPRFDSTRIASQMDDVPKEKEKDDPRATESRPPENNNIDAFAPNLCSSLSSPSGSSHSVIDPDVYINQADLFYQMPASPQRDLIEDYDNRVFKTMLTSNNAPTSSLPPSSYGKQARLIDQILAGYNTAPHVKKSPDVSQHPTDQTENPSSFDFQPDESYSPDSDVDSYPAVSPRTQQRASAKHRIPDIVDAFEARLSGIIPNDDV